VGYKPRVSNAEEEGATLPITPALGALASDASLLRGVLEASPAFGRASRSRAARPRRRHRRIGYYLWVWDNHAFG